MSNETKQTAVEWYGKQMGLLFQQFHWHKISITEFHYKRLELEEQAKEMEKEQIKSSWNHGFDWGMMEQSLSEQGEPSTLIDANHFYNQTYGCNK